MCKCVYVGFGLFVCVCDIFVYLSVRLCVYGCVCVSICVCL